MASFPVHQEIEGEWRYTKTVEILGLRIPAYFISDPQLLYDLITNFQTKSDDVFIATYPKSGTTWVQEIVWQIYHNGEINSKKLEDRIPFVEAVTHPKTSQSDIKTLPSPRLLKTHLSYDAIPKSSTEDTKCRYIYIACNPKDVAISFHKFETSLASDFRYSGFNAPWEFYVNLFIQGKTLWNHWNDHVLGWWQHRNDPNILFLKYEDLQKDLPSNVKMIANFLNKPLSDDLINLIAEQCTFNGMMKLNKPSYLLRGKEDGPKLLRKGLVGHWKNYFTPELNERFEKEVLAKLKGSGLEFDFEI